MRHRFVTPFHQPCLALLAGTCLFLPLLRVATEATPVRANAPAVSTATDRLSTSLQQFQWYSSLNDAQVKQVKAGLQSDSEVAVQDALKNVAIHGLKDLVPLLQGGGARSPQVQKAADVIARAFKSRGTVAEYLLRQIPKAPQTGARRSPSREGETSAEDILQSIVVDARARALRAKSASLPSVQGLSLDPYQQELLHYSGMSNENAVHELVLALSQVRLIGIKESVLVDVLSTYGRDATVEIIQFLSNAPGDGVTGYGQTALLRTLRTSLGASHLSDEEGRQLRQILSSLEESSNRSVAVAATQAVRRLREDEN